MSNRDSAGRGVDRQASGPWVYFIESTGSGRIKIGFTAGDVETRRKSLQTGSSEPLRVLAMVQGDESLERRLHMRFASDRVVGEWFTPSDALVSFVDGIHLAQEQHVTGHETRAQAEDAKRRAAREHQAQVEAEREAQHAKFVADWEAEHGEPYDADKAFQMFAKQLAGAGSGGGDPFASRLPIRQRRY